MIVTRKRYVFSAHRIMRPGYRQIVANEAMEILNEHHYGFLYVDDTGLIHFRARQRDRIERKYLYEVTDLKFQ